jgi:aspartate carbamoyltransferase regulatory subunit
MNDPVLSFLSEQVIRCTNTDCITETFRLRIHVDRSPNDRLLEWKVNEVVPVCPSCGKVFRKSIEELKQ